VDALLPVGIGLGLRREERTSLGRVAWENVHVDLRREVPQLSEPVAVLVDEVEGQPVPAGRNRTAHVEGAVDALAGRCGHLETEAVPDDRIAAVVEPVIGEVQPLPRRCAGILEHDTRATQRPRLRRLELVTQPAHGKRAGRHGVLCDRFQERN
jgi:hypothetical protein